MSLSLLLLIIVSLLSNTPFSFVAAQPEGWRMVDRFLGFRYEIAAPFSINNAPAELSQVQVHVQQIADHLGCFGWVQQVTRAANRAALVGEVRCSKLLGSEMRKSLEAIATDTTILVILCMFVCVLVLCWCL